MESLCLLPLSVNDSQYIKVSVKSVSKNICFVVYLVKTTYCKDKSFILLGNVGSFRIAIHRVPLFAPQSAGLQRTLY